MYQFVSKKLLLSVLLLCFSVAGIGQLLPDTTFMITLKSTHCRLEEIFKEINKQSGYEFIYTKKDLDHDQHLSLPSKSLSIGTIINFIQQQFNVSCNISEGFIAFGKKAAIDERKIKYIGAVYDDDGPIGGVSIKDLNSDEPPRLSEPDGRFTYDSTSHGTLLELTRKGYETIRIRTSNTSGLYVRLKPAYNTLKEVIVKAYNPTRRREATTSTSSVSGKDLPNGYNTNPISALQNKIPGLVVNDPGGVPGGMPYMQIRGQQSIGMIPGMLPNNNPLILVDGVTWIAASRSMSRLRSMAGDPDNGGTPGGISALDGTNIADIEKIEVFKDADATAIFGSRGAHGVISIWTRKGQVGGLMKYTLNVSHGLSYSAFREKMMNTSEYVAMRKEGLSNDGKELNETTAPDLFRYPTDRSTDWRKYMIGQVAQIKQYHGSASGGVGSQFSVYCGAGYKEESMVLPTNQKSRVMTFSLNASHNPNDKSTSQFSLSISRSRGQLPAIDPMPLTRLAPNAPAMYDAEGKLQFKENGLSFTNLDAALLNTYEYSLTTLLSSLYTSYTLAKRLRFNIRLGANNIVVSEKAVYPIKAGPPDNQRTGMVQTGASTYWSLSADPQLQYHDTSGKLVSAFIAGSTILAQTDTWEKIVRSGYTNDQLMETYNPKLNITRQGSDGLYRYVGWYAGARFTLHDKYLLNLTGRYDGSSRFGPEQQFALYGSAAAGWIFTNTKWMKKNVGFLTFGKIRANIGTTGNDNVGYYSFKEGYQLASENASYDGVRPIKPTQPYNPSLGWEKNTKKEIAVELQAGNNISLTISHYISKTTGQLIAASLAGQTGAAVAPGLNHAATVKNYGWEFWLEVKRQFGKQRYWSMECAVAIPRNKAVRFDDLLLSMYNKTITLNRSLTQQTAYQYDKVNPATGLYDQVNMDKNEAITLEDMVQIGNMDPIVYGSITNKIGLKQWEFSILIDGNRQYLLNPKIYDYLRAPGSYQEDLLTNRPAYLLDRWKVAGDQSKHQRFSAMPGQAYTTATEKWMSSSDMRKDGSYLRLRAITIGWLANKQWMERFRLTNFRTYLTLQNLITITGYEGGDPTIQNPVALPSQRTVMIGIEVTF